MDNKQKAMERIKAESHQIFLALARLHVEFGPRLASHIYSTLIDSLKTLKAQADEEVARYARAEETTINGVASAVTSPKSV